MNDYTKYAVIGGLSICSGFLLFKKYKNFKIYSPILNNKPNPQKHVKLISGRIENNTLDLGTKIVKRSKENGTPLAKRHTDQKNTLFINTLPIKIEDYTRFATNWYQPDLFINNGDTVYAYGMELTPEIIENEKTEQVFIDIMRKMLVTNNQPLDSYDYMNADIGKFRVFIIAKHENHIKRMVYKKRCGISATRILVTISLPFLPLLF